MKSLLAFWMGGAAAPSDAPAEQPENRRFLNNVGTLMNRG